MATFCGTLDNRQILLTVWVSDSDRTKDRTFHSYRALLDTGAQMTMISQKIVLEVGLHSIGDVEIIPVSGDPIKTERYMVRLDIPITQDVKFPDGNIGSQNVMHGDDIDVGGLSYQPVNYDVLVGMDFIRHFHITMYGENFILSN